MSQKIFLTDVSIDSDLDGKIIKYINGGIIAEDPPTPPPPPLTYGYLMGGGVNVPSIASYDQIEKIPYASDGNSTCIGNLAISSWRNVGLSSTENGYSAGFGCVVPFGTPFDNGNNVFKFPFASEGTATDTLDLSQGTAEGSGVSSSTDGYVAAGRIVCSFPTPSGTVYEERATSKVDKFPFASDNNATCIASIGSVCCSCGIGFGLSSSTDGYVAVNNNLQKFPFASDTNISCVAALCTLGFPPKTAAAHSSTCGYVIRTSDVYYFSFASESPVTQCTGCHVAKCRSSGAGSDTDIYTFGGYSSPPAAWCSSIDKFPFAVDASSTCVGSLTVAKGYGASACSTV